MLSTAEQDRKVFFFLLRELGGPYGSEIRAELGPAASELLDAVYERLKDRVAHRNDAADRLDLDPIDWAAIRAIVPPILARFEPHEFKTVTGYSIDEAAKLLHKARERIREFRRKGGVLSGAFGDCLIRLPTAMIAAGVQLVAVPDEASWDTVMPPCAHGRRSELLPEIQGAFVQRGEWRWIDRPASSFAELEGWVRGERAKRDRRRKRTLRDGPTEEH